jgi:hypothetical protein
MASKATLKQFFTHHYEVLQPFLAAYPLVPDLVIDPFAGAGHLLRLFPGVPTHSIDIDPDMHPDLVANSFESISYPDAGGLMVITNPPYCHRHILQKQNPALYEIVTRAGYTDLYEYAIRRVIDQMGFPPIFALLPENFIASRTTKLRGELLGHIRAVQVHVDSTCDDTDQPTVMVYLTPKHVERTDLWLDEELKDTVVIEADGFRPDLPKCPNYVHFGIKEGQTQQCRDTSILLQATDGGSEQNRIKLLRVYDRFNGPHFHNKRSDRAYIQIVPHFPLDEVQVATLIREFNAWVDGWRATTHGLGLTSFRGNSNGFRRKRLDFKLARQVINWIIKDHIIDARKKAAAGQVSDDSILAALKSQDCCSREWAYRQSADRFEKTRDPRWPLRLAVALAGKEDRDEAPRLRKAALELLWRLLLTHQDTLDPRLRVWLLRAAAKAQRDDSEQVRILAKTRAALLDGRAGPGSGTTGPGL